MSQQANTGGDRARRSSHLRVIRARDDVPASVLEHDTRDDCPTTRPCPHVRCVHHMQVTERHANQHSDGEPVYPKHVDPRRESCLLDLAGLSIGRAWRGPRQGWAVSAIARELGVSERTVYRLIKSGLRKLKRVARRRRIAESDGAQ